MATACSLRLLKLLIISIVALVSCSHALVDVTGVTPNTGSAGGGTTVLISGTGFSQDRYLGANQVFVGPYPCAVNTHLSSDSVIACQTAETPLPGVYDVTVLVADGDGGFESNTMAGAFNYDPSWTPTLRFVQPVAGPPGQAVKVYGDATWQLNNDCRNEAAGAQFCIGAINVGDYRCRMQSDDITEVYQYLTFKGLQKGMYEISCTMPHLYRLPFSQGLPVPGLKPPADKAVQYQLHHPSPVPPPPPYRVYQYLNFKRLQKGMVYQYLNFKRLWKGMYKISCTMPHLYRFPLLTGVYQYLTFNRLRKGMYEIGCTMPDPSEYSIDASVPGLAVSSKANMSIIFEARLAGGIPTIPYTAYTPDAQGNPYLFQLYAVMDDVSPAQGSIAGGTTVTISGRGFPSLALGLGDSIQVLLPGGASCNVVSSNYTQVYEFYKYQANTLAKLTALNSSVTVESEGGRREVLTGKWENTEDFSTPSYSSRAKAFYTAPLSGSYIFYLTADDVAQLNATYRDSNGTEVSKFAELGPTALCGRWHNPPVFAEPGANRQLRNWGQPPVCGTGANRQFAELGPTASLRNWGQPPVCGTGANRQFAELGPTASLRNWGQPPVCGTGANRQFAELGPTASLRTGANRQFMEGLAPAFASITEKQSIVVSAPRSSRTHRFAVLLPKGGDTTITVTVTPNDLAESYLLQDPRVGVVLTIGSGLSTDPVPLASPASVLRDQLRSLLFLSASSEALGVWKEVAADNASVTYTISADPTVLPNISAASTSAELGWNDFDPHSIFALPSASDTNTLDTNTLDSNTLDTNTLDTDTLDANTLDSDVKAVTNLTGLGATVVLTAATRIGPYTARVWDVAFAWNEDGNNVPPLSAVALDGFPMNGMLVSNLTSKASTAVGGTFTIGMGDKCDTVTVSLGTDDSNTLAFLMRGLPLMKGLGDKCDTVTVSLGTDDSNTLAFLMRGLPLMKGLGDKCDTVTVSLGTDDSNTLAFLMRGLPLMKGWGDSADTVTVSLGTDDSNTLAFLMRGLPLMKDYPHIETTILGDSQRSYTINFAFLPQSTLTSRSPFDSLHPSPTLSLTVYHAHSLPLLLLPAAGYPHIKTTILGFPPIETTIKGNSQNSYTIDFTFDPRLGDLPKMWVGSISDLVGAEAVTIVDVQKGSPDFLFAPLTTEITQAAVGSPDTLLLTTNDVPAACSKSTYNVAVGSPDTLLLTINDVPAACSETTGSCTFSYNSTITPIVEAVLPAELSFSSETTLNLTISGSGFSPQAAGNTVTVGRSVCQIVSATVIQIVCSVSNQATSGLHPVSVNVVGVGLAASSETVSLRTLFLTSFTPSAVSPSASTFINLTGRGFDPRTPENNLVTVAGVACPVTYVKPGGTELVALYPEGQVMALRVEGTEVAVSKW
eukprot:gene18969-25545_t